MELIYKIFKQLIQLNIENTIKLVKNELNRYFSKNTYKWSTGTGKDAQSHCQFSSVSQSYPSPCNPMNHSTPGLPVHHQLLECTQTHVYRVSDAIQPSYPLSSPPPAPNPSQNQGLFQ